MIDRQFVDKILSKTETRLELEETVSTLLKSDNPLKHIQNWILDRDMKIIELTKNELEKQND